MQGTQYLDNSYDMDTRIIPADAGNTACRLSAYTCRADHPRGCGEHFFDAFKVEPRKGSSPRMRGTPLTVMVCSPSPRIIPADAGNTYPKVGKYIRR